MTKNIFAFIFLILFIAVTVWFFIQKNKDVNEANNQQAATESALVPTEKPKNNYVKFGNGLEYEDLVVGTGTEAKTGDLASVHYIGTLQDGTKFDSSYDRGKAFLFQIGAGNVIKGWDLGIVGIKIGGKRRLIIPPNLGYGENGAGEIIPPNATLIFEVELLDLQARPDSLIN